MENGGELHQKWSPFFVGMKKMNSEESQREDLKTFLTVDIFCSEATHRQS